MVFIYVLELENNKYYIGKTNNPKFRLESHFNSNGSWWTKKYKPLNVIELLPDCDSFDEDKYTIKYMVKYGIENVRGGSFCKIKLSNENIITLNQIINSVSDKCYICNNYNHFAKDCNLQFEKYCDANFAKYCDSNYVSDKPENINISYESFDNIDEPENINNTSDEQVDESDINNKSYESDNINEPETNNISYEQKIIDDNYLNESCDCITSYFSGHRRSKCLLNNIFFFDDKNKKV